MNKLILLGICILFLLGLGMTTYSAILILDETNSGNLGDSMVMSADPNENKGSYTYMTIWGEKDSLRRGYIKFDTSRLIDTIVSNAILNFSRTSTTINHNLTKVYANISWGESTITWNNQPCGITINDPGKCNISGNITYYTNTSGSIKYNVTSFVKSTVDDTENNITFVIFATIENVSTGTPFLTLRTKERSDPELRPYLEITYTESNPPYYSNWQNNASATETKYDGSVNFSIDLSDDADLDYYIFAHNLSETLTNGTPIDISGTSYFANVTITVNLTRGNYICGQYWFNDTNGNINQTNLSCFTVAVTEPIISNIVTNSPRGYGYNISINATIIDIDGGGIENVTIQIVFPNMTSINYTMTNVSSLYSYSLDDTWQNGIHNFTIFANNTLSDSSNSLLHNFSISVVGVIGIQTINSIYNLTQLINLTDPPQDFIERSYHKDNYIIIEKSYLIEFKQESIFEYKEMAIIESESSIINKVMSIFFGDDVFSKNTNKRIIKHKENILDSRKKLKKLLGKEPKNSFMYVMNGITINLTQEEYNDVINLPYIKSVKEEGYHFITLEDSRPEVRADQVWNYVDESGYSVNGLNVTIAIMDSGIDYTNDYLGNCSLINLTSGNCERIPYGYDFYNNDNDPFDDHGHGTHCAGIIGANDTTGTYTGMAPNVKFLIYKVCSSGGSCPDGAFISAIENATLRGADIISISLGGGYYTDTEPAGTALLNAWNNGTIIIASAGNEGSAEDTMSCPGCLDFVIAVGAYIDYSDTLAPFSSRGYSWNSSFVPQSIKPDLLAPGWAIKSTVPTGSCILCDDSGIKALSGTSMSAPHVSGIAALIKQAHPNWTRDEIKSAIISSAVDLGYDVIEQGSGRVDAVNAHNATAVFSPTNFLWNNNTDISILFYNGTKIFNMTSKTNSQVIYSLSTECTNFNCSLNTTSITLDGYNTTQFSLNVTINNSKSSFAKYNGKIIINSSSFTYSIPISVYTLLNPSSCLDVPTTITSSVQLAEGYCIYPDIIGGNKFTIDNPNVVFDCNGSTIDLVYPGRGGSVIYVNDGNNNVTIKNCSIYNSYVGVNLRDGINSTVSDSYFLGVDYAILSLGEYATITRNRFHTTTEYFIQVAGNNSKVTYNDFNSSTFYAVGLLGDRNIKIGNIDILYNTFFDTHFGVDNWGADSTNVSYNNFTNTYLNAEIYSGRNHYYSNNRIIYDSNLPCTDCAYWGIAGILSEQYGSIYPKTDGILTENNFINVTKWGFFHVNAINVTHRDTEMYATDDEIYLENTNITLVNVTYDSSNVDIDSDSLIWKKWWITVNVTDTSNSPLVNVTVTVKKNVSNTWVVDETLITSSTGIVKIPSIQSEQSSSGITYYNINLTINKSGYYPNSTSYNNLSDNTIIHLSLTGGAVEIPTITVLSPTQNQIITTTYLMTNITTDITCINATYSLNGTTNITMNKTDNTHFYANLTGLMDNNTYNITFYANSTSGGWGISSIYYFTVNTSYTEPSITKSMINNTGNQDFRGYLTLKVQRNTGTWGDYKIVTNNQLINVSTTAPFALDIRWFADGAYTANVTGIFRALVELKDKNGNVLTFDNGNYINSTYEFNVTDANSPIITIVSPTHNSYIKINYSILNYTFTDDYNTSLNCYYILDGNETASPNNPITNNTYDDINMSNLNESTHTVYVKCDDGIQNGSSSTNTFTTDFTLPTITNPKPVNGSTILGTSTEEFTMSPSDTFLDVDSCRLYWKYPESETYSKVAMNFISNNCTVNVDLSEIVDVEEVYYYFEVNDTATNIGTLGTSLTPMIVTTSPDITGPSFSLNSTNASSTTYNGSVVQINLTITDDVAIDFYRLSTNDSVGFSWTNESLIGASDSTSINSSFDYIISNLLRGTLGWRVWANDTNGNAGQSNIYTFLVIDHSPPTYSNSYSSFQNNASTLTKVNGVVNWSITLTDNVALDYYIFAHNNTGTLTNQTPADISGTSYFANETITITKTRGNYICGQYWFNDTSNNINQTTLTESGACFTVVDTLPTVPASDSLTPNNPIISEELTGACSGSTDADSDTIIYHYRFYDVTDSNERQAFSSDNTYQLSSPEDLGDTFRVDCRAVTSLGNSADRTGTDLETVRTVSLYEINTFSDRTLTGNMTFLSSVYKNISIPYWAVVTKAELDLTGYDYSCYQETANVSTSCGGLSTGKYSYENNYFYINYSIPTKASTDSKWLVKHGNLSEYNVTINSSCITKGSPLQLRFYSIGSVTLDDGISYGQCYNGSSWVNTTNVSIGGGGFGTSSAHVPPENLWDGDWNTNASYTTGAGAGWKQPTVTTANTYETYSMIYEEAIWWLTSYPSNVTIRTNKEITYHNTSVFSGTVTDIDLNISSLQKCVNLCDESDGDYCNCTINFTSATPGILEYSNIEIDYLIPLNITFKDEKSDAIIEGETLSIYLETTGFSQLYSSTNPFKVNLSIAGTYDLKASSTNYLSREFVIEVLEARNDLVLHLINSTDSSEITFNIVDEGLNPLDDVFVVFTRLIGGTWTTIAEEYSDYAGQVKLDLDENYEYTINFSKTNYEDKEISLEPTESDYLIELISTIGAYNVSVYEGITYDFSPSNIVLNNGTKYNFTFTLNSTIWQVTNCTLNLRNGTTLLDSTSSFNSNSCFLRIEQDTGTMTNITSEAIYELASTHNFTVSQQYRVLYTYEGEFSLKNFLDDLTDFGMAGFDNFGRMILALIIIFIITALAAQKVGFTNPEVLIFLVIAQVWFFSYVNWLYLGFVPNIAGLRKYFIAILITIAGGAFVIEKFTK